MKDTKKKSESLVSNYILKGLLFLINKSLAQGFEKKDPKYVTKNKYISNIIHKFVNNKAQNNL